MTSIHRALEHRGRGVVALVALVATALVVAACGSSGSSNSSGGGSSSDAQTLLTQTFSGKHSVRSGRLALALGITAQGDPTLRGPVRVAVSGPFQTEGARRLPQFDLAADLSAQGQSIQAGLTSTGARLWVKLEGTSYVAPDELVTELQQSLATTTSQSTSSGSGLSAYGISPLDWLSKPSIAGDATVGGAATTHITASLNASKFLDDVNTLLRRADQQGLSAAAGRSLPRALTPAERQQALAAIRSSTIDVWTGKSDHTLRRVAVTLTAADRSNGSTETATVNFTLELDDLNQPQTITGPANARPLTELLSQFSGLLGSTGLSGSSSGSSSSSGTGSASIDKYTKCLTDAGSDVAKAQKCAALLGK